MPGTGVVYLDLRWSCLPSLIRHRLAARDAWSLRASVGPTGTRILRRVFGVRAIDINTVAEFVIVPGSSESAMRRALTTIEQADVEPLLSRLAQELPGVPRGTQALRSALLRPIAERSLDAFYVECWARSFGWQQTYIVTASAWDRLLLDDPGQGLRPTGAVSSALAGITGVIRLAGRAARLALARFPRRLGRAKRGHGTSGASDPAMPSAPAIGPVGERARTAQVALALNMGRVYGGLYAYDHVLDPDPGSPLHLDRVLHISTDGGPGHPDGIRHRYPTGGHPLRALTDVATLALVGAGAGGWRHPRWLAQLSWVVASSRAQARAIRSVFPALEVAVVAFEVQLPIALTLALQQAGVRTVAFNERPLSVMVESQPFVISTLLTAGPEFSNRAQDSAAITVTEAPATGMWRTDLLRGYATTPHPQWPKDRHRVLALPYHVDERPGFGNNPLAMSAPAVRQFLADCLSLAERRSDVHVIIRGKNSRWTQLPGFADLAAAVARMPNIEVSQDYDTLNESYRLAASADLVIAQYTSLVDEVLAVGIPSVIHDYLPNSRGYGRGIATHLPDLLWALTPEQWRERIDRALDDPDGFARAWQPHRQQLYADLADGRVRERARALVLDLLR